MTVSELQNCLNKFPSDTEVRFVDYYIGYGIGANACSKITAENVSMVTNIDGTSNLVIGKIDNNDKFCTTEYVNAAPKNKVSMRIL